MILFGELAPDIADLNTSVASEANNVIPGVNSYLPFKGLASQSNALTNPCQGAATVRDSDGNNYIFAGDKTKLYSITNSAVTDESQVGNYTDNAEFWEFLKWYDTATGAEWVIASKFGDEPQYLTLGSSTFADLGGSPPQAKTITSVREFIVLGNTYNVTDGNVSNRIQWSGYDQADFWTAGQNQSDSQDLQGAGGDVMRVVGGEYGVVFQERSIWRMNYVGTPLIFEFNEIPGRGTPAGGSVVQLGLDIYFLAQDGFYVLRDGQLAQPIGVNKIDRWFFDDLNTAYIANIRAAVSPKRGFIIWCYPSTASTDGSLDSFIIYNYKSDRWSTGDLDTQVIFQGASASYTLEELDSFGNMDTLTASLDSSDWAGGSYELAAFNSSNQMCFFSGSTLSATIETAEISDGQQRMHLQHARPVIDGTCTLRVSTRNNLSETPTNSLETALDGTGKANFRTNARYHRLRASTSGDFTHAIGIDPEFVMRGKR